MIKMKALTSFTGAGEGHIRRGREFVAITQRRADELEEHGLAFAIKSAPAPITEIVPPMLRPPPQNKAAHAGPLPLAGGEIGAESASQSSLLDLPQQRRRSRRSREERDS